LAVKAVASAASPLHRARSFTRLPDPAEAASLLADLAVAPCPFGPAPADRPLALYGAGDLGNLARAYLKVARQDFLMAIDRNAEAMADDPRWSGVRLLHPDAVPGADKRRIRLAVSIVTSPYVALERQLADLGFDDIVPFYDLAESFRHLHPLSNGWFAAPLSKQDRDNTARVLSRWDDDISRAHHLQFLAWRRLREEWTFAAAPMPGCSRFFIPEIVGVLHGDETLVDGGAYHGGVIEAFTEQTKHAFRQIVAVEPDPSSRALLRRTLQSLMPNDLRLVILDCALGADEGVTMFHDGLGYASQLSPTGTMPVAVRPLDALDLSPSFVKLHLEGAELSALKGARGTLLAHRPIVAATVYHNADGIWRTPLWLMETLPDYRFLFRLHSWCGTGAVVYGIPNERDAS
jgi:FkbM family methyltransferase